MIHARDIQPATTVSAPDCQTLQAPVAAYHLEEQFWGYRVVSAGRASVAIILLQVTAMIAGSGFIAAALVLGAISSSGSMLLRLPVIFVALCIGFALMWFASRGNLVQIEIDTTNGEVREVVRNRTGATTVVSRHGFDSIGNVFIARPAGKTPSLTLRYRNSSRHMTVAVGTENELSRLRDRMGRDMILSRSVA